MTRKIDRKVNSGLDNERKMERTADSPNKQKIVIEGGEGHSRSGEYGMFNGQWIIFKYLNEREHCLYTKLEGFVRIYV